MNDEKPAPRHPDSEIANLSLDEVRIPLPPGLAPRRVQFWKSTHWDSAGQRDLIIMHDGQNLFREEDSFSGIWGIVPAVRRLMDLGALGDVAVAGIWNSGDTRWNDYMPPIFPVGDPRWIDVDSASRENEHPVRSRPYGEWLVGSLIPELIGAGNDLEALAEGGPGYTRIHTMGSSMGGLVSLYLLCEYPGVFATAGCLSTHWSSGKERTVDWFIPRLPAPGDHRIYFDHGTAGLDAGYAPWQSRIDRALLDGGWKFGRDFVSHCYYGADHNEPDWRMRLEVPLNFMLRGLGDD